MIIFFALVGIIIQGYTILFAKGYIAELMISFVPYMIVGSIVVFLYMLIQWIITRNFSFIKISVLVLYLIIIIYRGILITDRYDISGDKAIPSSESLTFLYANIHYQNNNLSGLIDNVQSYDPDVVMFVEYAKLHDESLTTLMRQSYPYVSRYVGKKGYDGDILFSRYPLTKIDHPLNPGSFSHVQLTKNDTLYDLLLVHTSAPVSTGFFAMRNRQLDELSTIISTYMTSYPESNIIVAGDFNISPWSQYYSLFNRSVQSFGLTNQTTILSQNNYHQTKLPLTRCHEQLPFVCSHIDHIWSNTTLSLSQLPIDGSDHLGFIGAVQ